ncbi:MAG: chemotaxis signal transduction protein, partial [Gammaproteobacteria bacterium]
MIPPQLDEKKTEVIVKEAAAEIKDHQHWLVFELNRQSFRVDMMLVREVLKNTETIPVLRAPFDVQGIVNFYGYLVTVINTRAWAC